MINNLIVKNFKCFTKEANITMANLNVCTGMNSVGKSTLIQAILLMRQSYEILTQKKTSVVLLNTPALKLGSTEQIMSTSEELFLSIDNINFKYVSAKDKLSLQIKKNNLSDENAVNTDHFLFNECFYYLNSERLGPRNYQEMISQNNLDCGFHGEYTFDVISKKRGENVSKKRRFIYDDEKKVPNVEKQIEYWLGYIANGVEVNFSHDFTTQLAKMKVRQAVLDTPFISPYNFGFGISYVLPIITTGLIANPNSIIIVENPEAHLHPAGQSRIGEFLAHISNDNMQVVIETHSEHVINGIRKYALKNKINPNDICINYFNIDKIEQKHEVIRLELNERMDILKWPEGFFDQEAIDLKELRELRSKMK